MALYFAYQQIYTFFKSYLLKTCGKKRSSLLVDLSNFNKALNKNSSNCKNQKTTSIQFKTGKKYFLETFGHRN